jgi:hypothetical protein
MLGRRKRPHGIDPSRPELPRPSPRTLYGLYFRNLMLNRHEARDRALAEADRTGAVDGKELFKAMFSVTVRAVFEADADMQQIRRYVRRLRDWLGNEAISQLEAEALIRAELGDRDVPVDDIHEDVLLRFAIFMASGAAETLQLTEVQVDELVARAEDLTAERGFYPTPISEAAP